MSNILETWMPFDQFEQAYPEYRHHYYVKINEMIVFYEIYSTFQSANQPILYFTIEDAHTYINQNK